MCIKNNVTEKSRHFFDFSTIIASSNDPIKLENNTAELSIQPTALQISKCLDVNILSIVIEVPNNI